MAILKTSIKKRHLEKKNRQKGERDRRAAATKIQAVKRARDARKVAEEKWSQRATPGNVEVDDWEELEKQREVLEKEQAEMEAMEGGAARDAALVAIQAKMAMLHAREMALQRSPRHAAGKSTASQLRVT